MFKMLRAPITVVASREGSKGHFAWSRFATLLTTHSRYSHKRIKPACIRGSSASRSKHNARRFPWCRSTAAAILYTLLALCVQPAQAQDGHARWHMYYLHWKQPGTTISCCNARTMTPWGVETGDCEPTRYEMRKGEWYAWLRQESRWIQIPDEKLLRERNPSGEEGHLCYNTYTKQILCAVPPDTGG